MRYPYQTNVHWLDRATNSLTIGRQFCRPNIRLPRTGRDTPRYLYKWIFQKTKRFQCGSSHGRKQGNEKSLPGAGFGCQKQENLNRLKHPPSNGSISPQDFKLLLADWLLVDFQTKAPSEAHSRFLLKRCKKHLASILDTNFHATSSNGGTILDPTLFPHPECNRHHQDDYIFSRESSLNLHLVTVIGWEGRPKICIYVPTVPKLSFKAEWHKKKSRNQVTEKAFSCRMGMVDGGFRCTYFLGPWLN